MTACDGFAPHAGKTLSIERHARQDLDRCFFLHTCGSDQARSNSDPASPGHQKRSEGNDTPSTVTFPPEHDTFGDSAPGTITVSRDFAAGETTTLAGFLDRYVGDTHPSFPP